ncbi:MAG: hypothetical protein LBR15_03025 [Methanobrevibacter sp.]|nr:hypothetical protein [Candidatus Methanovirga australis]
MVGSAIVKIIEKEKENAESKIRTYVKQMKEATNVK